MTAWSNRSPSVCPPEIGGCSKSRAWVLGEWVEVDVVDGSGKGVCSYLRKHGELKPVVSMGRAGTHYRRGDGQDPDIQHAASQVVLEHT
jgi:hypothetical protein